MISIIDKHRKHDFIFRDNGIIDVSAHVARLLKMSRGDVVDIVSNDGELYITVTHKNSADNGRYFGRVYATCHGKGTFRLCSKDMARRVLDMAREENKLRCPAGEIVEHEGNKYVTIIYTCKL